MPELATVNPNKCQGRNGPDPRVLRESRDVLEGPREFCSGIADREFIIMDKRRIKYGVRVVSHSLFASTLTLVGCATESPDAQKQTYADYQRADEMQMLVEKFQAERRLCRQSGGHMVMVMGGGGKVDRRSMETAYCERRTMF